MGEPQGVTHILSSILDGGSGLSKVSERGASYTFRAQIDLGNRYLSFPPPLTVDKSRPKARTVVIAPD